MTRILAQAERIDPRGGYVVGRPRAREAIGLTLRAAFGDDARIPPDLDALLSELDRVGEPH